MEKNSINVLIVLVDVQLNILISILKSALIHVKIKKLGKKVDIMNVLMIVNMKKIIQKIQNMNMMNQLI